MHGPYFCDPGTKINGCHYRDIVLMQQVLLSIRSTAGDAYVFQQDSAAAHRARQTVELLQRETLEIHCSRLMASK